MKYPIRLLTYAWEGRYVSSVQAGIALVQEVVYILLGSQPVAVEHNKFQFATDNLVECLRYIKTRI